MVRRGGEMHFNGQPLKRPYALTHAYTHIHMLSAKTKSVTPRIVYTIDGHNCFYLKLN